MNIQQFSTLLLFSFILAACSGEMSEPSSETTPVSDVETDEWIVLFDGTSTDQWRGYNMDRFPDEAWTVEDGVLVFTPGEGSGLDIITKEQFGNFEFEIEWMISEGGNSGIFHHAIEQPGIAIYWSGLEYQLIDNENYGDLTPDRMSGSLYELKAADPQNANPAGEWNTTRIISDGPKLEYWQNGEKVVEAERWTAEWYEMIRGTKFENHPSFGNVPKGHIGLQDHGDEVRFRNIRIRRL